MNQILKIGLFYDGNYFSNVSNYYNYQHFRRSRINIEGLHEFVVNQVAEAEGVDVKLCKVTDAHYFRGRLNAHDAKDLNKLFPERLFDDMLMKAGVVTHYMPLVFNQGQRSEKGIDVALALECYEQALYKNFDIVVLVACDGDYLSLVRKLNIRGIRVMILSWDFNYTDDFGYERGTVTSQELLEAATYPLAMHEIIDNRVRRNEALIQNLFKPFEVKQNYAKASLIDHIEFDNKPQKSKVINLNKEKGFGFIMYQPDNIFFHFSQIAEGEDPTAFQEGDNVEFTIGKNERDGKIMAKGVRKLSEAEIQNLPKEEISTTF